MKFCSPLADIPVLFLIIVWPIFSHPTSITRALEIREPQPRTSHNSLVPFERARRRRPFHSPHAHHNELRKRFIVENALDHLDDDWIGWFFWVKEYIPIPSASAGLTRLYSQVYSNSLLTWVDDQPEKNFITMTVGFVQLTMKGDGGATIPWTFVTTFSAKLRHATSNGFRGSYTAYYSNPAARTGIVVMLTTLTMAAAAA